MNILIRNYKKGMDLNSAVAAINVVESDIRFEKELEIKTKMIFDDERLTSPFILEKQPNGNLCIDFKVEDYLIRQ